MNRRERRALYADHLGWRARPLTERESIDLGAAAVRGDAELTRWMRRRCREFNRTRTPGATARSRRLSYQRWKQRQRREWRAPVGR